MQTTVLPREMAGATSETNASSGDASRASDADDTDRLMDGGDQTAQGRLLNATA